MVFQVFCLWDQFSTFFTTVVYTFLYFYDLNYKNVAFNLRRNYRQIRFSALYLLLGKLNMVPSRTPAEGQRWVMVLRFV